MRLKRLLQHLKTYIPAQTPVFSEDPIALEGTIASTTSITFMANPKTLNIETGRTLGLSVNTLINPISIDLSDPDLVTLTTQYDHDFTEEYRHATPKYHTEVVVGNADTEVRIPISEDTILFPNRRTITILNPDLLGGLRYAAQGAFVKETNRINPFDRMVVTNTTSSSFTISSETPNFTGVVGAKVSILSHRGHYMHIASQYADIDSKFSTFERALPNYNKDIIPLKALLFVIPNPCLASKDRQVTTDSLSSTGGITSFRQNIYEYFEIVVAIPNTNSALSENAMDFCNGEGFEAVNKALLGAKLDYLDTPNKPYEGIEFVTHNMVDVSKAWYLHSYQYRFLNTISTAGSILSNVSYQTNTVAWRESEIIQLNEIGSAVITSDSNNDETPLT
jgi:hypothetical protein